MGKSKTEKFEIMKHFSNVFQNYDYHNHTLSCDGQDGLEMKGKWHEFFGNQNDIVLELGCGKGDYVNALAEKYPDQNFIGIDIKGNRLYTGARISHEKNLKNVAFVRIRIELLPHFFATNEVAGIWITFADPFPKRRDRKRRMTALGFLNIYKEVCKPDATIHIKVDDIGLFDFTLDNVEQLGWPIHEIQRDFYSRPMQNSLLDIQTHYEKSHLKDGRKINYLRFKTPVVG